MRLRTALNQYKQRVGESFPAEAPTTSGALTGFADRLVHVGRDGSFRDHSAALSGLYGVDRSRFGIDTGETVQWFDDIDPIRQHYYDDTPLVETEYDAGSFSVHQYDLTLGRAHLTHVELHGQVPADAELVAFLTLAPEGRETQVSQLLHEAAGPDDDRVLEVYHRLEHDYVAASTSLSDAVGQPTESIRDLLSDEAIAQPYQRQVRAWEESSLTGDVLVSAPLEQAGRVARTTLVTQLSDHADIDREQALRDVTDAARSHDSADALRAAARERSVADVPTDAARPETVRADLRALSLLTAPNGARIAAPEFDPFQETTGGYGYTWFRDDSEVSSAMLDAADRLGLDLDDQLRKSALLYCRTQRPDGSWPHRVWAVDERLAPGWANARITGNGDNYQADQTASVVAYLAEVLATRGSDLAPDERAKVTESVVDGVAALDDSLADDGLPERCQNAWEDMTGRFAHTAATFLEAYATVAAAPVDESLQDHARDQAETVFAALDALWSDERELYGLRLVDGELDDRADSAALDVVGAVASYAELDGVDIAERTLDRLASHLDATVAALYRDAGDGVAGLVRYEGDDWRTAGQGREKLWSVSTALGTTAAAELAQLFERAGRDPEDHLETAAALYERLLDDGPFSTDSGMLAEQVFDDGRVDSAAPLGWSHAVRLRMTAVLADLEALPVSAEPAGPDERPYWTTGEKYGVGTVADHREPNSSDVWFTLTEGALTEVRYPRVDAMNLRTLDFLVVDTAGDSDYVARTHNESRTDDHVETIRRRTEPVADDALLFRQVVTETGDGHGHEWTLSVEYATDPEHDALLADVTFDAGDGSDYHVLAVADPALTNTGDNDRGYLLGDPGDHSLAASDGPDAHREHLLVDENGEPFQVGLAMTSRDGFDWGSVEAAGSEGTRALFEHGTVPDRTAEAAPGNILLVGRLGTGSSVADTVGLGFAGDADTAGALGEADGALTRGFEQVRREYRDSWRSFLEGIEPPASVADDADLTAQYQTSLMTLVACEDKSYHGAAIASPSVPWGDAVPADEAKGYGYNFVWSRDLYQTFTALDCAGEVDRCADALGYIYHYQQDDEGFIPQNTYLQGQTRWGGEQMDNISFPQVMAYHLAERGLTFDDVDYDYRNVHRSADYVVRNGPTTAQERWEEEFGYSPSSIAAEIAGLTCAAALARRQDEPGDALIWQAVADDWVEGVEEWTVTETGTDSLGPTPYYVRVTRDGEPDAGTQRALPNGGPRLDERAIVDAGFLELVRLGIKPWDDPTIRNSVAVVDETIRVETPHGPAFYRYVGDGYGELDRDVEGAPWHPHEDTGRGRLWPIFTGERGEYELRACEMPPEDLLATMAGFANSGRMIPEQVWDRERPSPYNWTFGEGTGSATPLAWSMAQFVRLAHSLDAGQPVETPDCVRERYVESDRPAGPDLWVDVAHSAGGLVVTVETDAEKVAVRSSAETAVVEPTGDEFVVRVDTDPGESEVVVAAASDTDLDAAGTSVEQFKL